MPADQCPRIDRVPQVPGQPAWCEAPNFNITPSLLTCPLWIPFLFIETGAYVPCMETAQKTSTNLVATGKSYSDASGSVTMPVMLA